MKGTPTFTWNLLDLKRVNWQSPEALTPGNHTLEFNSKYDRLGFATLAFNSVSGIGRSEQRHPEGGRAKSSLLRRWRSPSHLLHV
ncbi:MAG: hypothetical protein WBX22_28610 [Silvibacterium sp.]